MQIARSSGSTVYAVAILHHHSKTAEYDASHILVYNDSNVLTNIANAARASGDIMSLAFDAIPRMGLQSKRSWCLCSRKEGS